MAEEIKPVEAVAPVESKPADKPVESVGKPAEAIKPAGDDKSKPAEAAKPAEGKPSEQLKSLLDEAGKEESKLDKDGKAIEEPKSKVPEKYEFKLPEGMTLDEAKLKIVEPLFKELGLDNVQAQKLVDLQLQMQKVNEDTHVQAWEAYLEGQKQEAKTYFGVKLPEVMRNVARARDTFISKTMQEKLNVAGFSNDKDFLETLDKIGRVIGEGKFLDGQRSAPARGTAGIESPTGQEATAKDFYPSMAQK